MLGRSLRPLRPLGCVVQMLKPTPVKNFDEYAQEIFIPYLSTKLQTASRLDLVWDNYIADSPKGSARAKHGKGVRRHVVAAVAIPRNWQNFLRADSNKTELFRKLSSTGLTRRTNSLSSLMESQSSTSHAMPWLAPCRHEEAGSHMLLHVSHATQHAHHKILIRTVHTDVVIHQMVEVVPQHNYV